ncbi:hypothetical protein D9M71_417040 [compost metagenome]
MAAAGVGLELIPVLRSSPEGVEPSLPLLLLVIPPLGARVDVVLEQLPAFSSPFTSLLQGDARIDTKRHPRRPTKVRIAEMPVLAPVRLNQKGKT